MDEQSLCDDEEFKKWAKNKKILIQGDPFEFYDEEEVMAKIQKEIEDQFDFFDSKENHDQSEEEIVDGESLMDAHGCKHVEQLSKAFLEFSEEAADSLGYHCRKIREEVENLEKTMRDWKEEAESRYQEIKLAIRESMCCHCHGHLSPVQNSTDSSL